MEFWISSGYRLLTDPQTRSIANLGRNIQFFATPTDLLSVHGLGRPKVVLAVPPSMSHGPSRWLFTAMAAMDGNVVLLTSKGEEGSLTRESFDIWEKEQAETAKWGRGRIGNLASSRQLLHLEVSSAPKETI